MPSLRFWRKRSSDYSASTVSPSHADGPPQPAAAFDAQSEPNYAPQSYSDLVQEARESGSRFPRLSACWSKCKKSEWLSDAGASFDRAGRDVGDDILKAGGAIGGFFKSPWQSIKSAGTSIGKGIGAFFDDFKGKAGAAYNCRRVLQGAIMGLGVAATVCAFVFPPAALALGVVAIGLIGADYVLGKGQENRFQRESDKMMDGLGALSDAVAEVQTPAVAQSVGREHSPAALRRSSLASGVSEELSEPPSPAASPRHSLASGAPESGPPSPRVPSERGDGMTSPFSWGEGGVDHDFPSLDSSPASPGGRRGGVSAGLQRPSMVSQERSDRDLALGTGAATWELTTFTLGAAAGAVAPALGVCPLANVVIAPAVMGAAHSLEERTVQKMYGTQNGGVHYLSKGTDGKDQQLLSLSAKKALSVKALCDAVCDMSPGAEGSRFDTIAQATPDQRGKLINQFIRDKFSSVSMEKGREIYQAISKAAAVYDLCDDHGKDQLRQAYDRGDHYNEQMVGMGEKFALYGGRMAIPYNKHRERQATVQGGVHPSTVPDDVQEPPSGPTMQPASFVSPLPLPPSGPDVELQSAVSEAPSVQSVLSERSSPRLPVGKEEVRELSSMSAGLEDRVEQVREELQSVVSASSVVRTGEVPPKELAEVMQDASANSPRSVQSSLDEQEMSPPNLAPGPNSARELERREARVQSPTTSRSV